MPEAFPNTTKAAPLRVIIVNILLKFGIVIFLLSACADKPTAQPAQSANQAIAVTYLTAESVMMPAGLETIAQTIGAKEIEIRPRISGIILKRLYREGTAIDAGQTLFQIDPEPFQHALAEAKATMREQQVRVLRAETEENRQRQLLADNFVSQRAYDIARADLAAAEAGLQAATARVRQAELNLSYTTVKAPFSGVTGHAHFSEGSLVSANSTVLTTLVQPSPIWAQFSFSNNELALVGGRLTESNVHSVIMILPDGSEYQQPGAINFAASQIDTQLGTQQLRATFDNTEHRVLPGQFIRIRITAGAMRPVFLVPQSAILTSEFGRYVYLISTDNTVMQRHVSVGNWLGVHWEILDGLTAGDKVIIDNIIKLAPGKAVAPQSQQAAPATQTNPPQEKP
ncbi:MAG: efflux RND transporter periplasmic adaptor subunit [Nitrosomonas sp.]|nr:MAG: efflux RND transporter periplasmic adaptor subunit [Nitrosomonas sp.]